MDNDIQDAQHSNNTLTDLRSQFSIGNQTTNVINPKGGNTITFNHTHNEGSNGVLVVAISCYNQKTITSVKYNGIEMTERLNNENAHLAIRYCFWELANPAVGPNEVRITGGSWSNKVATVVQSFTGATTGGKGNDGLDNSTKESPLSSLHTNKVTRTGISEGSLMMVMGICQNTPGSYTYSINGVDTTRTLLNGHKKMGVAVSKYPLSVTR